MATLEYRSADECRFDFLSMGALVQRLDPGFIPLHEAREFTRHCSGGEFNPAVGLAKCFGMRTAVATALVDNDPTGQWLESEVRRMGVTGIYKRVKHDGVRGPRHAIIWSDRGYGPRAPEVFYDRATEAGAMLKPGDFDWSDLFNKQGVRQFHSGGIFAALSPTTSQIIIEAMTAANNAGTLVSYDLNFRKKIWDASEGGSARAVDVNREIVKHVDILVGNEEDMQLGLGIKGPDVAKSASKLDTTMFREMIGRVREMFPRIKAVATTLREVHSGARHTWGAVLWINGEFHEATPVEIEVLDRIGGGDGFAGGLFYGLLNGLPVGEALRYGWAHGALLATTPGDVSMVRLDQVKNFGSGRVVR